MNPVNASPASPQPISLPPADRDFDSQLADEDSLLFRIQHNQRALEDDASAPIRLLGRRESSGLFNPGMDSPTPNDGGPSQPTVAAHGTHNAQTQSDLGRVATIAFQAPVIALIPIDSS